jgi:L,D-peptidoglycan transpeptidase YkuD (ErfK/YbiS/YcfS/YnhG family)
MMRIEVSARGTFKFRGNTYPCALGRCGVTLDKYEGDGATPAGDFPLRSVLFRPDRIGRPSTMLPSRPIESHDGWCDDPGDPRYNRIVSLPYPSSAERLWRDDHIYDVIVVIGYNDDPPIAARGSAIFLHAARKNFVPTAGCVALAIDDLLAVLRDCDRDTEISITG